MKIYNLIEEITLDQLHLTDQDKNRIIANYSDSEWNRAIHRFLSGIERNHQVPGHLIGQLWDISHQYSATKQFSRDQKWLILHTLLENWDQIGCLARAEMDL